MEKNNHAYSQVWITVDVFENSTNLTRLQKAETGRTERIRRNTRGTVGGEDGRLLGLRLFLQ